MTWIVACEMKCLEVEHSINIYTLSPRSDSSVVQILARTIISSDSEHTY